MDAINNFEISNKHRQIRVTTKDGEATEGRIWINTGDDEYETVVTSQSGLDYLLQEVKIELYRRGK